MPNTAHRDLTTTRGELGWGVYELGDLRAYMALSGGREDARHALPWLRSILNPVRHVPYLADYSFSDLISLFVVRELLGRGVTPGTIRRAEAYLRRKWKTDRPFVSEEIQTDGRGIYVDEELAAGRIESADLQGQQVMRQVISDRLMQVRYHDGTAESWTPVRGVIVDPRIQFGEPVLENTRVPTEAVAAIAGRQGVEAAATLLEVPLDSARAAVDFERELARAR